MWWLIHYMDTCSGLNIYDTMFACTYGFKHSHTCSTHLPETSTSQEHLPLGKACCIVFFWDVGKAKYYVRYLEIS